MIWRERAREAAWLAGGAVPPCSPDVAEAAYLAGVEDAAKIAEEYGERYEGPKCLGGRAQAIAAAIRKSVEEKKA